MEQLCLGDCLGWRVLCVGSGCGHFSTMAGLLVGEVSSSRVVVVVCACECLGVVLVLAAPPNMFLPPRWGRTERAEPRGGH